MKEEQKDNNSFKMEKGTPNYNEKFLQKMKENSIEMPTKIKLAEMFSKLTNLTGDFYIYDSFESETHVTCFSDKRSAYWFHDTSYDNTGYICSEQIFE